MHRNKSEAKILVRNLLLAVLALAIFLFISILYLSSQARREISEQFIDGAVNRAVEEFRKMSDSMEASLKLVRDWSASGLLSLDNPDTVNRLLFPIFDREHILYGISVADIDGNSYYIRLEGDGLRSSHIEADRSNRQAIVKYWDAAKVLLKTETNDSTYDPRKRPWFTPTLEQKETFWTEPYKFYASDYIGVTASLSHLSEARNKQIVVAIDILLDELFTEIYKLAPSINSRVVISRQDLQIYIPKNVQGEPEFRSISSIRDTLIKKVFYADNSLKKGVVSVVHEGETWWSDIRPLNDDSRNIWFGVMVPEKDIIGHAGKRQTLAWFVGFVLVLIASVAALVVYQRLALKLEGYRIDQFDPDNPETSMLRLIDLGEGPTIEFKSTMRMNLHTGKPSKEIELAWLKAVAAFLNSDGGTLLFGVTDNGEITGLERDAHESNDKCKLHFKNLIAHHIGAEHSPLIHFEIIPVGDKMVGVAICEQSKTPIFVTHNKREAFYLRNGPSSDELPVSKVLSYIKKRK